MRLVFALCLLFYTIAESMAQEPKIVIDIDGQRKPYSHLDWNNKDDLFQFAIVTDRTGGHRPGVFETGINKLNLLQPEFVMSVGDLIEGYTTDTDRLEREWKEFTGFIDQLEMPFFYVPGNHDITNATMEQEWNRRFGATYYHFVYHDVLFLCLNSEDNRRGAGKGTVDDEQYVYIKSVLGQHPDVRYTMVFIHQPLWVQDDTKRWNDVEELLSERPHHVFAGHYHRYWKTSRNRGNYIALATTGGSSRLRGRAYGEFDHVVWVTMTSEGPVIANLLLEGIWDEDVVTEDVIALVREQPFPVEIETIYTEDLTVVDLTASIKVVNDSDYPMFAELEGLINNDYRYRLMEDKRVIHPNSVNKIELQIDNVELKDLSKMEPVRVRVKVTYQPENEPELELRKELRFQPLPRNKLPVETGLKFGTNSNEWPDNWIRVSDKYVTGGPFLNQGDEDCEIDVQMARNNQDLLFMFRIRDDIQYASDKVAAWEQDALIVGLDARREEISGRNTGGGRGSQWISLLQNFGPNPALYDLESLPEGTRSSVVESENMLYVQIAVPLQYLADQQSGDWSSFRMNLVYYDYDQEGKRSEHYLYPNWNSIENIPGSGMWFKD